MEPALLEKARNGDVEAFAALFEPWRPTVYRVACRLVGPDEAGDVVMETFLKAWKALPRYEGRAHLQTWLYRICWNTATDWLRARQRRRELPLDEMDATAVAGFDAPGADAPAERLARADDVARVRRALATLSEEHRTALLLRYADDLSYAEIAAATGVAIGTVMSRLFNGRRHLLRRLKHMDADE